MKKNKLTFAQRAKELEKSYPRAAWDAIEKRDFEKAMNSLMQEQEAVRASKGMNNTREFRTGGSPEDPPVGYQPVTKPMSWELNDAQMSFMNNPNTVNSIGQVNAYAPRLNNVADTTSFPTTQQLNQAQMDLMGNPDIMSNNNIGQVNSFASKPLKGKVFSSTPWQNQGIGNLYNIPTKAVRGYGNPIGPDKFNGSYNEFQVPEFGETSTIPPSTSSSKKTRKKVTPSVVTEEVPDYENSGLVDTSARDRLMELTSKNLDRVNKSSNFSYGDRTQLEDIPEERGRSSWLDRNKKYAPYAISGLSNIASNLALAAMAGKNIPKINASRATADLVDFEPQAEQLRKDATTSKNISRLNARNVGANPGALLSGAASTGIDRAKGKAITDLYTREAQINSAAKNRANLFNAQDQSRVNQMNAQLKAQAKQDKLGYLGEAFGTVPKVMTDIRADKADEAMRRVQNNYFKSMGRNYLNEGDLFDNKEDGYTYTVKNNKLVRQGKIKS